MSNRITEKERRRIQRIAAGLLAQGKNRHETVNALATGEKISRDRARGAVAKVELQSRRPQ